MSKILICLFVELLIACTICKSSVAQEQHSFEIKGKILGLSDKSEIILIQGLDTIDRVKSNGEYFRLKGIVSGGANYYFLKIPTVKEGVFSEALWLENKKMKLESSISIWPHIKLNGSQSQLEYLEVKGLLSDAKDNVEKISICKKFIKNHKSSLYVSNLILRLTSQMNSVEIKKMYDALSNTAKESFYGKKLKDELTFLNKNAEFYQNGMIGAIIPNFRIRMVTGDTRFIHDLIKDNKYTLIDFWASWCGPCRKAFPQMRKVYERYQALGFNIIGVSTDKTEVAWRKALKEDKTPWIHGLDNIDNASEDIFGLIAIPAYLLVDNNCRILRAGIASKLRQSRNTTDENIGTNLNEIIDNLFKKLN